MKIVIESIPHKDQRYDTAGDWYYRKEVELIKGASSKPETKLVDVLYIKVSELADWRQTALIAVHELFEVLQCQNDGITQKMVDDFDMAFEKNRQEGNEDEPGDDPAAPYAKQHCFATAAERMLCAAFGLSWKEYEEAIGKL